MPSWTEAIRPPLPSPSAGSEEQQLASLEMHSLLGLNDTLSPKSSCVTLFGGKPGWGSGSQG